MLRIVSVIENSTIFATNNAFDKILTSTYYVAIYASQDTTYKEAGAKQPDLLGVRNVVI